MNTLRSLRLSQVALMTALVSHRISANVIVLDSADIDPTITQPERIPNSYIELSPLKFYKQDTRKRKGEKKRFKSDRWR